MFMQLSSFAMAVIHKKLEQMPKFLGIARLPDGTLDLGSMHLALNVRRHRMLLDVLKQIGEIILDKNLRALQLPLRQASSFADALYICVISHLM